MGRPTVCFIAGKAVSSQSYHQGGKRPQISQAKSSKGFSQEECQISSGAKFTGGYEYGRLASHGVSLNLFSGATSFRSSSLGSYVYVCMQLWIQDFCEVSNPYWKLGYGGKAKVLGAEPRFFMWVLKVD